MVFVKRKLVSFIVASGLLTITACAGKETADTKEKQTDWKETTTSSSETITEEKGVDDSDSYQNVPYSLYPVSENSWVGDVMPMADGDKLQLYYLYDTDNNGSGYHPIYKFSTSNFYEYQDDGLVIPYGDSEDDPDFAVGTGSVLKAQDGKESLCPV